jgi:hypothetical protein
MSSHVSKRWLWGLLPAFTRSLRQVRWYAIIGNLPLRALERIRGSLHAKFIVDYLLPKSGSRGASVLPIRKLRGLLLPP